MSARPSFSKLNYLLRPSKQVERKLFIETFHSLAMGGFRIKDYTYVGFGSIYYADFILFHKYLYITKMVCVEQAKIPKRMQFNLPFRFIQLEMQPFAQYVTRLQRDTPYIVWLDYDIALSQQVFADVTACCKVLCPGSALIVTVEGSGKVHADVAGADSQRSRDQEYLNRLKRDFGRYYSADITQSILSTNGFPKFIGEVLATKCQQETNARKGLSFDQLFNFRYADGRQMVTVGGIIADADVSRRVQESGVHALAFIERGNSQRPINLPMLTVRERLWLDQQIGSDPLDAQTLQFELDQDALESYRQSYRDYPNYQEGLF